MPEPEPLRLVDLLTTAASIADLLGEPEITPTHLLQAMAVLDGTLAVEALGRPVSAFGRRSRAEAGPAVRELAQRWWAKVGGVFDGTLSDAQRVRLEAELRALTAGDSAQPSS